MGQNYQNIIVPTLCFPPISILASFVHIGCVHIEAHENYQKKSFRNKYFIGTRQGPQCLSIPLVKGKNHQMPIRDVRICYSSNWAQVHWKSIQTNYGNAAYFLYYEEEVREMLMNRQDFLYDFNLYALEVLKKILQLSFSLESTTSYQRQTSDSTLDLRRSVRSDSLAEMNFPSYYQVFQNKEFIPNLSILDALFHLGPETPSYLQHIT